MKPAPDRQYVVVVDGARHRVWGRYGTAAEAQAACAALLRHGFLARIVNGADVPGAPERNGVEREAVR